MTNVLYGYFAAIGAGEREQPTAEARRDARSAFDAARSEGHLWEYDSFCAGFEAAPAQPTAEPVQASASDAPPCWWIDHGSCGQITQREEEAIAAAREGKRVVRYSAAPVQEQPARELKE